MLASLCLAASLLGAPSPPGPVVWPEHRENLEVLPPDQLDVAEAKRLFNAGKQAAEHGRWDEAIRYFAEAYRHSGSPGQLYSLGRGHRELYFHQGRDPVQLRLALLRFHQYLDQSPDGRNRTNASNYIDELQPYVTVLEGFDQPVVITRLMVHSPIDGATVEVDASPPRPTPITLDVEPGEHQLRVRAPGYHDTLRTVAIPEGATVPIEVPLTERPATLQIVGPERAELFIDGNRRGQLPAPAAIALSPGNHQVAVARAGRVPFVRDLDLARGAAVELDVELPMTAQRKIAFAAMGLGGAGLVTTTVLAGLALRSQSRARQIEDERRTQGISESRYAQQQQAWQQRDRLRAGAIASGITGGLVLGAGVVLYFTDRPRLGDRLHPPPRARARARSWYALPTAGRGWAGTSVGGRF
ncbi:MAG: PEGA domain-containing protein [Deltaproteobacteria bacterium]|nr:PEGA domain-containing protein [Deltaproteobacteria bacterium]